MLKLCLMASHGHPPGPGFVFHQEQGMCRVVKDCQPCLPIQRMKQEIIRPSSVSLTPYEEPWTPISSFCESRQIVNFDSRVKRPILIDMQDNVVNSVLFSYLVTKQCAKHERILRFLTSGHSEVEKGRLDFPALSELMELQALAFDEHQQLYFPSLIYPSMEVDAAKHLLDVVGHICSSKMSFQSDGQVPITSSGAKMEDILSILTEFYSLNTTSKWRKELLVPPFSRLNIVDVQHNKHTSSLKLEAVTATPLKSPGKLKHKPSLRKKNSKKGGTERDLYKANYFHACESLLSLMISKKWQGKTSILSLKKSGPELPKLLNQFSAGIAGTGLAVVFSVMCKLASGRVPLSGSKLLSTGFGFGLVWLSWAVNRLRDTILYINKNTKKVGLKEEEMMTRVDRSVNEIYFRAATLLAVAVLRFA